MSTSRHHTQAQGGSPLTHAPPASSSSSPQTSVHCTRRTAYMSMVSITAAIVILGLSSVGDSLFNAFGVPLDTEHANDEARAEIRAAKAHRRQLLEEEEQRAREGAAKNNNNDGVNKKRRMYIRNGDEVDSNPRKGFMLWADSPKLAPLSNERKKKEGSRSGDSSSSTIKKNTLHSPSPPSSKSNEISGNPDTDDQELEERKKMIKHDEVANSENEKKEVDENIKEKEAADGNGEKHDDVAVPTAVPTTKSADTPAAAAVLGGRGCEAKLDLFPTFDYDKSITEIVKIDNRRDGVYYNVPASKEALNKLIADSSDSVIAADELEHYKTHGLPYRGDSFLTTNDWKGKCFYETHNFCVLNGTLTFFHKPSDNPNIAGGSLRMCTEFSQHSPTIRLKYETRPLPADGILPAPLMTKTPAWIVQYWCQDLFHMTLTMLPAYQTLKQQFPKILESAGVIEKLEGDNYRNSKYARVDGGGHNGKGPIPKWWDNNSTQSASSALSYRNNHYSMNDGDDVIHPDIFVRIAKGKRKKSAHCRIKLGDPRNWEDVRNGKWNDKQFPIAGNPYWPFYQTLTSQPDRIYPLYRGATGKSACYTNGIVDKLYIKSMMGDEAREYTGALVKALEIKQGAKRKCGKYRLTLIDRRGRTRKLTNIPEIAAAATAKGFIVTPVALETLPIRKQLELISSTDVLMGMHGNGITWLQFLPPGSAVVELVGVWYTPYPLLWGHKHFHSSMKNNMAYKQGGEFNPFAHNVTEVAALLDKVKEHLDQTSCKGGVDNGGDADDNSIDFKPPNDRLENLYKDCVPHC